MSFNSSPSSNASLKPDSINCLNYRFTFFIFTTFSVTNILLLLPLYMLVLHLGLQRWQKQRSTSMTSTMSHSDVFTYHMVAAQMIGILGCGLYCCGACLNMPLLMPVGMGIFSAISYGQNFFDVLSCVDRYLAVVHPITYLGLRKRGRIRIRNVIMGCVWLLFLGSYSLNSLFLNSDMTPLLCVLVLSMLVVTFCSLAVLHALIRPGPGEGGTDRERVHQSKMRAFHTIMAIMGAMLLRSGGYVLVVVIYSSSTLSERFRCEMLLSGVWFSLPSSLVLPLLFLHRAGKLVCRQNNTESGH